MNETTDYDDLPLWSAPFGLTLLETVKVRKFMNILDIGSGSGFPMLEIAERFGMSCMVYGIDPSERSLAMINAKKEARGIVNARILKGVAEEIPFPDGYFELIVSNNGLNNVADQPGSFAECYRVCDNGAQMVITMNLPHTMTEFYELFGETLKELGMEQEFSKMEAHIAAKRQPVEALTAMIEKAGFTIQSIQVDGFKMKYAEGTSFFNSSFIRNAFLPSWLEIVPDDQVESLFTTLEEKLNHLAELQGELAMSVPFVCFDCTKT